jgi:N-acetyl-gamma-glutamyl-phosphate reductase
MHTEHPGFIQSAMRVSNPGCWPQGVIAALRPLVYAGLVSADYPFTVNGISGYSGGGRGLIGEYEARKGEVPDFLPYGLGFKHKHLPEMQRYARLESRPLFMPAVGNFYQGMLVCMPLQLNFMETPPASYEMHKVLSEHYNSVPGSFIQVAPLSIIERSDQLNPQALNGTNYMRLHVFGSNVHGQAILMAVYDNLGKGAAGSAIQNLNLMLGLELSAGLV